MAIIKYRVEAKAGMHRLDAGSTWQYEEVKNPLQGGRLLTREEALKIIEERELVLVHQTIYGSVWDEPDEPMWQEYNGCFSRNRRY